MVKRNTIQRMLVFEMVNMLKNHATVEDVYKAISSQHPNISRATVYRNLNLLSEEGEIKKIEVPGGPERFDHINKNHYHIRCLKCNQIFDVDMKYIKDLEKKIKDKNGFEFSGHDIMFRGLCPNCKTGKSKKNN